MRFRESVMKPIVILVKGPSAGGKTTITRALIKELVGFEFLNIAAIKESWAGEKEKTYAEFFPRLEKAMKDKKNILLQELFAREIEELVKKYGYKLISVYLDCSLDETKKRNASRNKVLSDEYLEKSYKYLAKPEKKDQIINTEGRKVSEVVNDVLELLD